MGDARLPASTHFALVVTSFAGERPLAESPLRRRAIAGLLAAVVLPIPLVSAYGLTLPLPGFVGRMAFALVPGTGAEQSAASASPHGVTIAHVPGEKVSEATSAAANVVPFAGRAPAIGTHRPLWTPLSRTIGASPAAAPNVGSATPTTSAFQGGAPPDVAEPAAAGSTTVTGTGTTPVVTPSAGGGTGSTSAGAGSNGGGLTSVPGDTVDGTPVPTPVGGTGTAGDRTPVDPADTPTTPTPDPVQTVTDTVRTVTDTVPTVTDTVTTVTDTVPTVTDTVTDTVTAVTDTVTTVTDTVTTATSGLLGGLLPPGSGTPRKKTS